MLDKGERFKEYLKIAIDCRGAGRSSIDEERAYVLVA